MIYKDIKIDMPKDVIYIINTLQSKGYEAYIVGGAVRNSLLNVPVKDWDITTNALPENVIDIFTSLGYHVVETGLKHGTVTVMINKEGYEITTYRIDGTYTDGRHPDTVTFTRSLKEDLSRRDFTINSMCYNSSEGLIDCFDGLTDLQEKMIKCVGNADERFNEDALRMLRAIRFCCQLGFHIHPTILYGIESISKSIKNVSKERIRDELSKILVSNNTRKGIVDLEYTTLLYKILPELGECCYFQQCNSHHYTDVFGHTLDVIENVSNKLELRLSAMLHDIAKPICFSKDEKGIGHFYEHAKYSADMSKEILTRLKFDNKTIETVSKLIYNHMTPTDLNNKSIKKLIIRVGQENIYNLIELIIADRKGMAKEYQNYDDVLELKNKIDNILNEKQPLSVKDLAINGDDLIELGYKQGKEIGETLNWLLEKVIEDPELNNYIDLLEVLKWNEGK